MHDNFIYYLCYGHNLNLMDNKTLGDKIWKTFSVISYAVRLVHDDFLADVTHGSPPLFLTSEVYYLTKLSYYLYSIRNAGMRAAVRPPQVAHSHIRRILRVRRWTAPVFEASQAVSIATCFVHAHILLHTPISYALHSRSCTRVITKHCWQSHPIVIWVTNKTLVLPLPHIPADVFWRLTDILKLSQTV